MEKEDIHRAVKVLQGERDAAKALEVCVQISWWYLPDTRARNGRIGQL